MRREIYVCKNTISRNGKGITIGKVKAKNTECLINLEKCDFLPMDQKVFKEIDINMYWLSELIFF